MKRYTNYPLITGNDNERFSLYAPCIFHAVDTDITYIYNGTEEFIVASQLQSGAVSYDELTDTPLSKVGQSLKIPRVSLDETTIEYVDLLPDETPSGLIASGETNAPSGDAVYQKYKDPIAAVNDLYNYDGFNFADGVTYLRGFYYNSSGGITAGTDQYYLSEAYIKTNQIGNEVGRVINFANLPVIFDTLEDATTDYTTTPPAADVLFIVKESTDFNFRGLYFWDLSATESVLTYRTTYPIYEVYGDANTALNGFYRYEETGFVKDTNLDKTPVINYEGYVESGQLHFYDINQVRLASHPVVGSKLFQRLSPPKGTEYIRTGYRDVNNNGNVTGFEIQLQGQYDKATLTFEQRREVINAEITEELGYVAMTISEALYVGDSLTSGKSGPQNDTSMSYGTYMSRQNNWNPNIEAAAGWTSLRWYRKWILGYTSGLLTDGTDANLILDFTNYQICFLYLGTNLGYTDTIVADTAGADPYAYADTETGKLCAMIEIFLDSHQYNNPVKGVPIGNENLKIVLLARFKGTSDWDIYKKIANIYGLYVIEQDSTDVIDLSRAEFHPYGDDLHFGTLGYAAMAKLNFISWLKMVKQNLASYDTFGTELTVPDRPTGILPANIVATAGDGQASIDFVAPLNNGNLTIQKYIATSSPEGLTGELVQPGSGTIVVTGLTNAVAYTFTVKALNSKGLSDASNPSNSVTPAV